MSSRVLPTPHVTPALTPHVTPMPTPHFGPAPTLPPKLTPTPLPVTRPPLKQPPPKKEVFPVGIFGADLKQSDRLIAVDEPPPLPPNSELKAISK